MKAATSIIRVDLGRWKFVITESTTLYSKPGYIKISVQPESSLISPHFLYTDSKVLILVVPTAIIFYYFSLLDLLSQQFLYLECRILSAFYDL